jgi:hypothetical protein
MNKNIVKICGENDTIPDFEKIGNDPNFVFTVDPDYVKTTLYDSEGNSIIVNSWLECANYVNGGWVSDIIENNLFDTYLFYGLLLISFSILFFDIFKKFKTV